MKKLSIITLTFLTLLPFAGVHAQDSSVREEVQAVPTRQNIIRERIQEQRDNYRQNLQEARKIAEKYRKAESVDERNTLREEARRGFMVRLTNAVEQLANMQDRVEARIEAAQENEIDTTNSEELLLQSKTELQNILDLQDTLQETLENKELEDSEIREQAKLIFDDIKENFKKSRMNLLNSIRILKATIAGDVLDTEDNSMEETEEQEESEDEVDNTEVEENESTTEE